MVLKTRSNLVYNHKIEIKLLTPIVKAKGKSAMMYAMNGV